MFLIYFTTLTAIGYTIAGIATNDRILLAAGVGALLTLWAAGLIPTKPRG